MSQVSAWANVQTDNGGRGYSADDLADLVFDQTLATLESKAPGFAQKVLDKMADLKRLSEEVEALRNDTLKIMPGDTGHTAWAAICEKHRPSMSTRAVAQSRENIKSRR